MMILKEKNPKLIIKEGNESTSNNDIDSLEKEVDNLNFLLCKITKTDKIANQILRMCGATNDINYDGVNLKLAKRNLKIKIEDYKLLKAIIDKCDIMTLKQKYGRNHIALQNAIENAIAKKLYENEYENLTDDDRAEISMDAIDIIDFLYLNESFKVKGSGYNKKKLNEAKQQNESYPLPEWLIREKLESFGFDLVRDANEPEFIEYLEELNRMDCVDYFDSRDFEDNILEDALIESYNGDWDYKSGIWYIYAGNDQSMFSNRQSYLVIDLEKFAQGFANVISRSVSKDELHIRIREYLKQLAIHESNIIQYRLT